jgi:lysylphosphatidylglycerol synthetase-like protein (DUF2156 family)
MSDLLLILPAVLLGLALHAVHRGEHRRHAHLMIAAMGCIALGLCLAYPGLQAPGRPIAMALLGLLGVTAVLGRGALAWREGHPRFARVPRLHRAAGALSLLSLALGLGAWLLRRWH